MVEVDAEGSVLDEAVPFQFDADAAFDPALHAVGELVFVLNDTTPAFANRRYRVLFDVAGACGECPPPPAVPAPTTLDSLQYEGQATWLISTASADYYYHREGAASRASSTTMAMTGSATTPDPAAASAVSIAESPTWT